MEEWAVSLSHNHRIDCQTELVKRFLEGVSSFIQDTLRARVSAPDFREQVLEVPDVERGIFLGAIGTLVELDQRPQGEPF